MTPIDLDAHPGDLSWADVDPSRVLAPEAARARAIVVEALMDTERGDPQWRRHARTAIGQRFAHAWGPWTCGWSWAVNSGGVVSSWCCTSHSLCPQGGDDVDVDATAGRAAEALLEWHGWLLRLGALFTQLDVLAGGVGRVDVNATALASAASRIVELVVEQTHAEDAWYFHCGQVLGWFLEHQGVDPHATAALIERAIGGRFESWVGPADNVRHEVADIIGRGAAGALSVAGAHGSSRSDDGSAR